MTNRLAPAGSTPNDAPLRIEAYSQRVNRDVMHCSALVDGQEIFFETRGAPDPRPAIEPFIAMALLEAMVSRRALTLVDTPPLSEKVAAQLPTLQAVLASWNTGLRVIPIIGPVASAAPTQHSVGSFFSAGIDSMHTLAEEADRITHLIVSRGFDHDDDDAGWLRRQNKQAAFAAQVGKQLVTIDTNARRWMESRRLTWRLGHGLYLSSIGALLGFRQILIPASHTYNELFPWGSHPLTDPLWSTESTEVIHFGAACRRTEKTEIVLRNPLYADNIAVCWKNSTENCGSCPKCVRTMIAIYLLGGTSKALPAWGPGSPMSVFNDVDEGLITFVDDLMLLAREKGQHGIARKLAGYRRKYHRQLMLHAMDEGVFRGMLRRLKWAWKPPEWSTWRVNRRGR